MENFSPKRQQEKLQLANHSEFSPGKSTVRFNYIGVFYARTLRIGYVYDIVFSKLYLKIRYIKRRD